MTLILSGTDSSVSAPAVQGGTGGTTTGLYYPATNQLALATNGTQALLVDSSQNVGIGTASPGAKLDVQGTSDTTIRAKGTSGTAGGIFRADGFSSGSYPGFQLAQSGTHYWTIGQRGDTNLYLYRESGAGNVVLSAGTLQTPSTVSVGGATPSSSGAGITFPATQSASSDANTLDDYEEGTWTPVDNSGAGLNMSGSAGSYTKIGRLVNVRAKILYPATSNTAASFISGMPFTLASQTAGNYPGNAINANGNTNAGFALAYEGSTQIALMNVLTQAQATNNNLSSANINFSLTYMTS